MPPEPSSRTRRYGPHERGRPGSTNRSASWARCEIETGNGCVAPESKLNSDSTSARISGSICRDEKTLSRSAGGRSATSRNRSRTSWFIDPPPLSKTCRKLYRTELQRVEERDQIRPFLRGKPDVESLFVEIDHVPQRVRGPVMEIGSTRRQAAQRRPFQFSDVLPRSRDERAPGIGGHLDLVGRVVLERDDRKIADVQRAVRVGNPDVQRNRQRVVPHVRRVVTGAAGPRDRGLVQIIVQSGHSRNGNRLRVEQRLPARNARPPAGRESLLLVRPRIEQVKDHRGEQSVRRVAAQRVVDPDIERGRGLG